MKTLLFSLLLALSSVSLAQSIPVMNFQELEPRLHMDDEHTWVINFWATWCAPCVKEMPYFENIGKDYAGKGVKVLLVSLDFANQLEARVIPFVERHGIEAEVILLNDPRANSWIPKVSDKWSGALPATLIYNKNHRSFYEQTFTLEELKAVVENALSDVK
jgi:thiol-disulfide isomerase/thioredoxin